MSSLRRRAICVQRAMSIARSSTGGRASARTTAPASLGSTSSRSQASRSRTSARWKNAAAPASRCGTARSSSATATAWPSLRIERTSTQMSSGATSSRATSRSISAATACACARSLSQRQNATSPRSAVRAQLLLDPVGHALGDRPRRHEDPLRAAVAVLQPHDGRRGPLGLEVAQVLGRRAAQPVDRLVVVAGGADLPVLAREQPHQQALGEVRVLQLVDEQVAVARRHPRPHARLRAQEPEGVEQQVAEVERPRLLEHPVVGRVEGGELALAVGLGAERPRPRRVVLVRDELVLEAVDAADDRAEQRARVAAQVMGGERQLVDALEQHRDPVGRRDGRGERVEPGLERLVVQQPRAEVVHGRDGQLVEAPVEAALEPLAQPARARLGDGEDEDRLRRQPALADQPARSARTARSSSRCPRRRPRAAGRRCGRWPRAGGGSATPP